MVRMGTNDLKYHATESPAIRTDAAFANMVKKLEELQQAFGCKIVFFGAGVPHLNECYGSCSQENHLLGGPGRPRTEVRLLWPFLIIFK